MNLLTQAAEQALVVLNNTTHTGPAMSRCIFNLKAALDAAKTTAHPVGWQQRFICPTEGPSCWQSCDDNAVRLLQARYDYEVRPVFSAPNQNHYIQSFFDGLGSLADESTDSLGQTMFLYGKKLNSLLASESTI